MEYEIDNILKRFYKDKEKCETIHRLVPDKDGELPSLPMESCYINLAIVKHIGTERHDQSSKEYSEYKELRNTFIRPRSSEELNLENIHYQVEDLFHYNNVESRRIFIFGRAGIGKTTLCKKIVYEVYVKGLWKDKFKRIIWLPLRILKGPAFKNLKTPSLADVYTNHYFPIERGDEMGRKLVRENEDDENQVLYVLDGLDEIQNFAESPILKSLFSKPFIVVTSRPYTFCDDYNNFDVILETIGFSQENIFDYISVIFDNTSEYEKRKEIIEFIEKSPTNIAGIVNVPILLDIICYTWSDIKTMEKRQIDITMTRLYTILEKYLWGQFLYRVRGNDDDREQWRNTVKNKLEVNALVNDVVDVYMLSKVAYDMLSQNKIEFDSEEAFKFDDSTEHNDLLISQKRVLLKNTHFLNCLNPSEDDVLEISKSYTFIHLTMQEYLAAVYLVKCFKEKRPVFDTAISQKYNPRYSMVWSFVAGILSDSKEELGYSDSELLLDTFFNFIERDPTDELGIAHQFLIVNCLNECSYPSLLNCERETRFVNELFSFIFTQYVAGGKSLFKQQLPLKVLQKFISTPDEFWEADSKIFKQKVFKEQFLPDIIVKSILDDVESDKPSAYSTQNLELLISQSYLGITAVKSILSKLQAHVISDNTEAIKKYLKMLSRKSFLPSDDDSLLILEELIAYCSGHKKELKDQILMICLKLREIPFQIISKLAIMFSSRKHDDILFEIIKNQRNFPPDQMMQLVIQKCFSHDLDKFVKEKLFDIIETGKNVDLVHRLLLIIARRKIDDDLLEKLLELIETEHVPCDIKFFALYVIGNMKRLPENVANKLITKLDPQLDFYKKLKFPTFPTDWSYLQSIILLMKSEFYESHQKQRLVFKFKDRRFLSNNRIDLKYFDLFTEYYTRIIKQRKLKQLIPPLVRELENTWNVLQVQPEESVSQFESDGYRFLNNFTIACKDIFIDWYYEKRNPMGDEISKIRIPEKYKEAFAIFLEDEWDINSPMYYEILLKYRPLVVLANKIRCDDNLLPKFQNTCTQLLLEFLIIRALRDVEIPLNSMVDLHTIFFEKISPKADRLTINIAKVIECQTLDAKTINKILKFINEADTYDIELMFTLLRGQTLTDSLAIEQLQSFLLPEYSQENSENTDELSMIKYRFLGDVFQNNHRLLHSVQSYLLPKIFTPDFSVKLKVLELVYNSQIKDEAFLMELPDIIKNCRQYSNWSRLTMLCVQTLLNQNTLPARVLEKMSDYFEAVAAVETVDTQYENVYLGFLRLLRTPLPKKCIEGLYSAINDGVFTDVLELLKNVTWTENTMKQILKMQPLWNIIRSECNYKFKEKFGCEMIEQCYTIKEVIIAEKILHENQPMAIQKINGSFGCFTPYNDSIIKSQSDSSSFSGLLERMYSRPSAHLLLNLPVPLDTHHKYLKFHSHQENLQYIRNMSSSYSQEYFYIKLAKDHPENVTEELVKTLIQTVKSTDVRHLDLRNSYFGDADIFELAPFFQFLSDNPVKRLTSLILSGNNVGAKGLNELLLQLQKSPIDYVFLDQNLVFFSESEYREFIDHSYRSSVPSVSSADQKNPKLNVRMLDLSLNFIPNGDRLHGDPFSDQEIQKERHDDMKECIQNSFQIHSQNLRDNIVFNDNDCNFRQIKSYCHTFRNPTDIKYITTETGCVMVAEKRGKGLIGLLFKRGHAFMVIEWIPDSEYGQRQLILADLQKVVDERSRLIIGITNISPQDLKETLRKCAKSRTIFKSNDDIKEKLIPKLFRSKKEIDVYDYVLVPSKADTNVRGRLNCISWTDEMLKVLNITYDSMHESKPLIYIYISLLFIFIASICFWLIVYFS